MCCAGVCACMPKFTAACVSHQAGLTGGLCDLQAEFDSRCEMYEAQIQKGQRALERADQEKARLEEQLMQVPLICLGWCLGSNLCAEQFSAGWDSM